MRWVIVNKLVDNGVIMVATVLVYHGDGYRWFNMVHAMDNHDGMVVDNG